MMRTPARSRTFSRGAALAVLAGIALSAAAAWALPEQPARPRVKKLRIQILSTMLAEDGIGEWGFAALVEADGRRVLFDTGARPDTVLNNARELQIDLSQVTDVILSHNHYDHTGGLLTLRRAVQAKNPAALSRAHVGAGIFWSRVQGSAEQNPMLATRPAYEATGGVFIQHDTPTELYPGVYLTGPVPRRYPERNWSKSFRLRAPTGEIEDNIPEDQSLVIDTEQGLVLISGCGHAGIINTVEYARKVVRPAPLHAAVGGFHLLDGSDPALDFTADKLREFGVANLVGAHCTGIESVFHLRQRAGLSRRSCVVGSVGATFVLGEGIHPGRLAK